MLEGEWGYEMHLYETSFDGFAKFIMIMQII